MRYVNQQLVLSRRIWTGKTLMTLRGIPIRHRSMLRMRLTRLECDRGLESRTWYALILAVRATSGNFYGAAPIWTAVLTCP